MGHGGAGISLLSIRVLVDDRHGMDGSQATSRQMRGLDRDPSTVQARQHGGLISSADGTVADGTKKDGNGTEVRKEKDAKERKKRKEHPLN